MAALMGYSAAPLGFGRLCSRPRDFAARPLSGKVCSGFPSESGLIYRMSAFSDTKPVSTFVENAQMDERRKRLKFRAWRRGFREIDLILGGFADLHLADLSAAELEAFERLLQSLDNDVYDWITGVAAAPPEHETSLLARVRSFQLEMIKPAP